MMYKTDIKDPKLSRLLLFHGLGEKYGWTFDQVEKVTGVKLKIHASELLTMLRGVYAGESRYYRRKSEKK